MKNHQSSPEEQKVAIIEKADDTKTVEDIARAIAEKHNITIVSVESMGIDPEKTYFPELLTKANAMIEKSQSSLEKIIQIK